MALEPTPVNDIDLVADAIVGTDKTITEICELIEVTFTRHLAMRVMTKVARCKHCYRWEKYGKLTRPCEGATSYICALGCS